MSCLCITKFIGYCSGPGTDYVYYQSFKVVITNSNGRESISLITQRSECDVGMLEWMMSDSDIFRLYVLSTHNSAKTGTGLLAVI